MMRTPSAFLLQVEQQNRDSQVSHIEALALLDRDEADDASSLSKLSSSEEDIDEHLFG